MILPRGFVLDSVVLTKTKKDFPRQDQRSWGEPFIPGARDKKCFLSAACV